MAIIPTEGVAFARVVAATLGHPVTYDDGALCTHPNINKWSRWKPVKHNKVVELTEDDIRGVSGGLLIPNTVEPLQLINIYQNNSDVWVYDRPSGGAASPYRIGDFRNYDKDAQKFFEVIAGNNLHATTPTINVQINYTFEMATWLNFTMVQMTGRHFGAIIRRIGTTSPYYTAVSPTPLADGWGGGDQISVPWTGTPAYGQYEVFPFFADLISLEAPIQRYYAIEGGKTIITHSQKYVVNITAERVNGIVSWELIIWNDTGSDLQVTNVTILARYNDKTEIDPLVTGEGSTSLGTITVPANSNIKRTGSFTAAQSLPEWNVGRHGYIRFQCSSPTGLTTQSGIVEPQVD